MRTVNSSPFRLRGRLPISRFPHLNATIEYLLGWLSGLNRLDQLYARMPECGDETEFLRQVFQLFDIRYQVMEGELANIPRQGPVLVVANHPYGGLDGMIMAAILKSIRPDVKIMANYLLQGIPELGELFISVDPFAGEHAVRRNIRPLREAIRWVESGGVLVLFPAGEVSHVRTRHRTITDPKWSRTLARIVRATRVSVVPAFFHGHNSRLFYFLGVVHPLLRTLQLPRELINKSRRTIQVSFGEPISFDSLKDDSDEDLVDHLRLRTYQLSDGTLSTAKGSEVSSTEQYHPWKEIAPAFDAEQIAHEVNALPPANRLTSSGVLTVYYAEAGQIPVLLNEIGRLREITFRETGEGTGKAIDIDHYDDYYLHLFIWNEGQHEVVGAYRLGLADEILRRYGKKGLYSYSLFFYRKKLLQEMEPAIELGRSFVRKEYQRSFAPLMLLWKGIAEFVARHPKYHSLFGPVSLSNDYNTMSRQLLLAFLQENNSLPRLARLVRPRQPYRSDRSSLAELDGLISGGDLERISALVSEIEKDHKGVPILLKQYLKLGGKLLGFNVDPDFNNAIDGLILVDLLQTDRRILQKYMGKQQMEEFVRYHASPSGGVMDKYTSAGQ
jgi:putative hemolysin